MDVAENDLVGRRCADDDTMGARDQHRSKGGMQFRVIDLVIVTAPKPPGSRQLISPTAAVLEIAPAKVLQGAVRLQGLASSPTPETHVREAWACAGADARNGRNRPRTMSEKPNDA